MFDRICVLATGSREWADRRSVLGRLRVYHPYVHGSGLDRLKPRPADVLLVGGASGLDSIAATVGEDLGFLVEVTPYFSELGRKGGSARNALLVDKLCCYGRHGYKLYVEAFLNPRCVGTLDCLRRVQVAKDKGARITVCETHEE